MSMNKILMAVGALALALVVTSAAQAGGARRSHSHTNRTGVGHKRNTAKQWRRNKNTGKRWQGRNQQRRGSYPPSAPGGTGRPGAQFVKPGRDQLFTTPGGPARRVIR
jgi:hypothetical protein